MAKQPFENIEVLDETYELSLVELCQSCTVRTETIIAMVEEGLIEPLGTTQAEWRFTGPALHRVEMTLRLQRDLEINLSGAVLAVELLEEIDRLRERLRILDESL